MIKKLPGRPKPGEVTLTRGLTEDNSFEKWIKSSQFGKMGDARKGGSVIVYDFEGTPIKRYKLAERLAQDPRDRRASRPATPACSPRSSSSRTKTIEVE